MGWRRVLAGLVGLVLAAAGASAEPPREIRIATEGAFPPFNFLDAAGEPQGFEIDLGRALCEAMGARCTFVVHEWDGIVRALLAKEYDAIMSSLHITANRRKRIAFSRPYYLIPPALIGRKDGNLDDASPASLSGRTIGTVADSHHAAFLEHSYKEATIRTFGKLEEANLDLFVGRLDLVLADKLALWRFLESREGKSCCRFVADVPADPAFYGEGVAVGLRKEDAALKDAFDAALAAIKANGVYDRVRARYFPFDVK
jgi:polar amino acid transport system substrate-binding protein